MTSEATAAKFANRIDPSEGAYNGYSLDDRRTAAQYGRLARFRDYRPSKVPQEFPCAVCRQPGGQIGWHSEDYRTPLDSFAVCAWCHWAVHARLKPRQAYVWDHWIEMLADGYTPPRCPWGTRWQTWAARYLRKPPHQWDWTRTDYTSAPLTPFAQALTDYRRGSPSVPAPFDLIAGAEHMYGQWNAAELAGRLIEFNLFDPPLRD